MGVTTAHQRDVQISCANFHSNRTTNVESTDIRLCF